MTATDELRRLLDERGVEWSGIGDHTVLWCRRDSKYANYDAQASDWGDKLMLSWACTPEQAIEATLGRGTCHAIVSDNLTESEGTGDAWANCSECGHLSRTRWCLSRKSKLREAGGGRCLGGVRRMPTQR